MTNDRRITIRDVAEASGHAVSTVSNALADKRHVNEETRKHIQEIAKTLGYRPSTIARALRMQTSSTIGVLVADVANPASPEFIRGIDDVAQREGCNILLCNTDGDERRQIGQMQALLDRRVDGMILLSQHTESPEIRKLLDATGSFVLVQRRSHRFRDDYVGSDNMQGTRDSMNYLDSLGHRRIGFVTGPQQSSTAMERLEAYEQLVSELGLDADPELVFQGDYTIDSGIRAMHYFAGLSDRPTAIIASNDVNAIGLQDAAVELGLRIPEDFSLLGCDDIEIASLRRIDLTTLRLPKREMGAGAAELLIRRIRTKKTGTPREVIFPTHLTIRGSCAAPRR
ncbi:LacI family DNA-binding transcriptional regulator [Pelagibacterium montanilacus]|uniref:LacI family DNA-binding transcriptional regulator n=1 Tax=Pelagibacterium montanilacus TaxID=2185280 RepID=UPI000F8CAFE0|nr:LacI family DNA-binding transcriptional regulator [Pelagibacterium montanilacus]